MWMFIKWKPLNGITLGQKKTDSINWLEIKKQMSSMYIMYERVIWELSIYQDKFEHINWLMTLSMIPLCRTIIIKQTCDYVDLIAYKVIRSTLFYVILCYCFDDKNIYISFVKRCCWTLGRNRYFPVFLRSHHYRLFGGQKTSLQKNLQVRLT